MGQPSAENRPADRGDAEINIIITHFLFQPPRPDSLILFKSEKYYRDYQAETTTWNI